MKKWLGVILAVLLILLAVPTPILADDLIGDGDSLTGGNVSWDVGTVSSGITATSTNAILYIKRNGAANSGNVYANGANVSFSFTGPTVTHGSPGPGFSLTGTTPPNWIIGSNWVLAGARTTDIPVTLTLTAVGPPGNYVAKLTYSATGRNAKAGEPDNVKSVDLEVKWTIVGPSDTTPPVVTAALSPSHKVAPDWNNADVTITWSASDPESGIASGPTPASQTVTTEGANQVFTATATNGAGLVGNGSVTLNIDKTNPTITGVRTPDANSFGWNNSDVTVTFTATDALSGIDHTAPNELVKTVSSEGLNQSVVGIAFDVAKNKSMLKVEGINIDKTAPVVTATAVPVANDAGWNNTDVVVTFSATDALSGVATIDPPVTVTIEGEGQVITGHATDKAGNVGTVSITLNIDKTAPTITGSRTPGANANGWNNTDVTVSFTGSDSLSGIASVSGPTTLSGEGAGQSVTGTATDKAGNSASATVSGINIDKTAPTVTITGPSVVLLGAPAVATVAASDTLSGLAVDPSGAVALNTSTVGSKTISATATDKAGNSTTTSFTYSVIYGFNGLLDPYSPTKVSKAGSTVPLKWQYTDYLGKVVSSVAAAPSIVITNSSGTPITVEDSGKSGLQYDPLTNTWQWNWQTKGLAVGTYKISITSGQTGQTNGTYPIQLR